MNAQELSIFELKTATNTVYEKIAEKNQTKSSVLFYYIDFKMKIYAFYSATFHSVPRINHGNKGLNAVNKMMVGPSESLYRRRL
ncbi:hypothetical protein [Yeosuana sp. AK3]